MSYTRRTKGVDFPEGEEQEVCYVKPKRQKTSDGRYYNVPVRSFDQICGVAGNCSGLVDSCRGEIGFDTRIDSGRQAVSRNPDGDRPPLLKSARGRVQVLYRLTSPVELLFLQNLF